MVFLQHGDNIDPVISRSLCIRTLYNFTYRLSGNTKVADVLTEKALIMQPANHNDDVLLLKQAWEGFLKYYGYLDFKGEDPTQQALLSLSPEIRCAIILRDILGYSYGQIASVLNKSASEVGTLISIGRQEITKSARKPNNTG